MSIASEITRLQTSKADSKAQINIDKDIINDGIDFINDEKVDSYDEKIAEMQEAYKQYIPINSTSDTQIEAPKGGTVIGKTIKGNTSQNGTPTPDAPVEIKTVTGLQNINVSNGTNSKDYEINLDNIELNKIGNYQDFIRKGTGKNKFNYNAIPILSSGANVEIITEGVKISARTAGGYRFVVYDLGKTTDLLNKTIRINSIFKASSTNQPTYKLVYCDADGNNRTIIAETNTSNETISGTINSTTLTNVGLMLALNHNSTSQEAGTYADFTNTIVTIDDIEMTYEPYGYKDKWYIEKNVGKVVFNGSEDWKYSSSLGAMYLSNYMKIINNTDIGAYSNKYMATTRNNYNANNYTIYGNNAGVLSIRDTDYTNVNTFKTYLSTANVYAYYVLANPTYSLINNEELIEQLDRIMQLYEGQNNILVTGDLAATLDLDYIVKAENHL